jgi:hypothetical protein
VLGAGAGAVVGENFGVRRHKAPHYLRVFIIHGVHFIAAKIAKLFNVCLVIVVGWSHKINLKFKFQSVKYRCFAVGKTL